MSAVKYAKKLFPQAIAKTWMTISAMEDRLIFCGEDLCVPVFVALIKKKLEAFIVNSELDIPRHRHGALLLASPTNVPNMMLKCVGGGAEEWGVWPPPRLLA